MEPREPVVLAVKWNAHKMSEELQSPEEDFKNTKKQVIDEWQMQILLLKAHSTGKVSVGAY